MGKKCLFCYSPHLLTFSKVSVQTLCLFPLFCTLPPKNLHHEFSQDRRPWSNSGRHPPQWKAQIFSFFTIRAAQAFCQNIQVVANSKIATGKDIKDLREQISKLAKGDIIDVAKTNIAFTNGGLTKVCGAVCIESDATNKA
jgi:hypothetical protein